MNLQTFSYLVPYLISFLISMTVGLITLRRRKVQGASAYSIVAFSQALWTLGYTFELVSPSLEGKIFWDDFQWLGAIGWYFGFFGFSFQYTGREIKKSKLLWVSIAIVQIVFLVLVITNPAHGLIRNDALLVPGEPFSVLVYSFTPTVLVWAAISYIIFFIGFAILIKQYFRSQPIYKFQTGTLIIGTFIPLVGTLLTIAGFQLSFQRDTTPLTFAVSNLIIAYSLLRFRLFNILPLAREIVVDEISDGIIILDPRNYVVDLNPAAKSFIIPPVPQVIGLPIEKVLSNWSVIVEKFRDVENIHTEIAVERKNKQYHIELNISPLRNQLGRPAGRLVMIRDITDRKRAEGILEDAKRDLERQVRERTEELEQINQELESEIAEKLSAEQKLGESEERFRSLASAAFEGIVFSENGIITDGNEQIATIFKYELEEIIGRPLIEFVFPEDREYVREQSKAEAEGPYEHRAVTKNGEIIHIEVRGKTMNLEGRNVRVTTINEITQRKKMENALRVSEEKHRQVIETANEGIVIFKQGKIVFYNPKAVEIIGYPLKELTELPVEQFAHPEDREKIRNRLQPGGFDEIRRNDVFRFRLVTKAGDTKWIESREIGISWEGEFSILSMFEDITDIVQAEEDLQRYADRLNILHKLDQAILAAKSEEEISQTALTYLKDIVHNSIARIGIFDFRANKLNPLGSIQAEEGEILQKISLGSTEDIQEIIELLRKGQTFVVNDTVNSRKWADLGKRLIPGLTMKSILMAPLMVKGELLGRLAIAAEETNAFNPDQIEIINQVASTISIAIQQGELYKATQSQLNELKVLHALSSAGVQAANVEDLLNRAVEIINKSLDSETFTIGMVDEEAGEFHFSTPQNTNHEYPFFKTIPLGQGIASQVLETGKAINIPDIRKESDYIGENPHIISELCVPINASGKVIGVLNAESTQEAAFTEGDERFLTTISGQLATEIQNIKLFDAEFQARQLAETLQAANATLSKTFDPNQILDSLLEYLEKLVPYDSAGVMIMESDTTGVLRALRGHENWTDPENFKSVIFNAESNPVLKKLLATKKAIIIPDTQKHPGWQSLPGGEYIRSWIGVPLIVGNKMIGQYTLDKAEANFFTQEHLLLAEALASQAAVALQNANLYQEATLRAADLDALSQISTSARSAIKQDELLSTVLKITTQHLNANAGAIIFQKNDEQVVVSAHGPKNTKKYLETHKPTLDRCDHVLESGKASFVSQNSTQAPSGNEIFSTAILPLQTSQGITGLLYLNWKENKNYSEQERQLLTAIADITGNAIDRANILETLETQVKNRTKDLTALYEITAIASAHTELKSMMNESLEKILEVVEGQAGAIHIVNGKQKEFSLSAVKGLPEKSEFVFSNPVFQENIISKVIQEDQPFVIMDIPTNSEFPKSLRSLDHQVYIGVRIGEPGQELGVLSILLDSFSKINSNNVQLLGMIVDQMKIAVERALLQEQAEEAILIEERQRLARDLHDAVTQSLYSLTLMADAALKFLDDDLWARSEHYLREVKKTAQQVLKEMRLLVYELRPAALEREGLAAVLQQRLETVENRAGVEIEFIVEQSVEPPVDLQVELYRIAQEALNNALKYAEATSVIVRFTSNNKIVELEICDDGQGFDPKTVNRGIGLTSIEERTKKFGGKCNIISTLGEGTKIRVTFEEIKY